MHKIILSILAFLIAGSLQAATVKDLTNTSATPSSAESGAKVDVAKNGGTQITSGGAVVLVGSGSGVTLEGESPTVIGDTNGYVIAEGSSQNPITIKLPTGTITVTGSAALLYDAKTGGITLTVFSGGATINNNGKTTSLTGPHAATGNNLNALTRNLLGKPINPRAEVRLTALLDEVDRLAKLGQRQELIANAELLRASLSDNEVADNNYMPEAFRNRMVDPSLIVSQD